MKSLLIIAAFSLFFNKHCHWEQPSEPDASVDSGVTLDSGVDAGKPDSGIIDAGNEQEDSGSITEQPCFGPPGLFVEGSCTHLADGIRSYKPRFELWADGANKQRFIYLPSDATIDVSNQDRWTFPQGTRLYKTFFVDGKMIETRLIEKIGVVAGIDSWSLVSYAWSEDQKSVTLADIAGVPNALGTMHDIPSQAQCKQCHTMQGLDAINGFGAIQLNYAYDGITLHELLINNRLSNNVSITETSAVVPNDEQAFGYLHANCGHCHGGPTPRANLVLWLPVGSTTSTLPIMSSAVCSPLARWTGRSNSDGNPFLLRVSPGHHETSGIIGRMSVRALGEQMPPIATEIVDAQGISTVSAWIDGLSEVCPQP